MIMKGFVQWSDTINSASREIQTRAQLFKTNDVIKTLIIKYGI